MKTTLYQLQEQGGQAMSYILRTRAGRLVVIDGGEHRDTAYLLEQLKKLADGVPVVEAWFLTHAHYDHITAFMEIVRDHAQEVTIRRIYYRFPDAAVIRRFEPESASTIEEFERLLPLFASRCTVVNTGDAVDVEELHFDVLTTPHMVYPTNTINNASVVLRLTVDGQRLLFLADLGEEAGDRLLAVQGAQGLRADICQMAHHGQRGVSRAFYAAVAPKLCLWPTPQWLWDNDNGQGYNTHIWQTVTVRGWMEGLGVTRHIVSKDGTQSLTLPASL